MAESTYDAYAESQKANMSHHLEKIRSNVFFGSTANEKWYIDYWEKNAEAVLMPQTAEEEAAFDEHSEDPDVWETEWHVSEQHRG